MNAKSLSIRFAVLLAVLALAFFAGRSTTRLNRDSETVTTTPERRPAGVREGLRLPDSSEDAPRAMPASARFAQLAARSTGSLAADDERQRLIEQWAKLDPRAALDFVRTHLKGDRQAEALSTAISIWGENDPAAAWDWVSTKMPDATHHFDNLLEVFGKKSTELAAQYASRYAQAHPEAAIEVNLAALLGVTYRGDFEGARALIDRNAGANIEMRSTLNNFVAGQWARYAPAEAAAWVMQQPPGVQRDHALIGLGESWSERDPAAAAAFAATLPEGEPRSLAMRQAVSKWVMTDPDTARKWVIESNQYQDFDAAVEAIATQNNFMYREPAKAMIWATGIFNDAQRAKTMGTVLHNWYAIDSKAATVYLQTSPEFTPVQRTELLKQLVPPN